MIDLYRNIKQLREDKGLSQDELAKKTGYTSRSSIAKIEKGEVDLPRSKIIAFAAEFDVLFCFGVNADCLCNVVVHILKMPYSVGRV